MKVLLFAKDGPAQHPEVEMEAVPGTGDRLMYNETLYKVNGRVFYTDSNTVVLHLEPTSSWWDRT